MKKQNERTWLLRLTDEQYNCIIRGMEFYHRMMCGQVEELSTITKHLLSQATERQVKQELFPELDYNESWGWNGSDKGDAYDVEMARSYQIYREMRHQDVLLRGVGNVYSSDTLQTGKADKLIVERIK